MDSKKFTDKVCSATGLEKKVCESFLESLVELLEVSIAEGDTISIPSFGNFEPRKRNERVMTHPSNPGKRLLIPPKLVVSFKTSTLLKNKINSKSQ